MNVKRTTKRTPKSDVPYNPRGKTATLNYWKGATAHHGVAEPRAKRGRPAKPPEERKEQIALRLDKDVLELRLDKDVLEWYREQGAGWQTRMNAVLKTFRDAAS